MNERKERRAKFSTLLRAVEPITKDESGKHGGGCRLLRFVVEEVRATD
jgi:hypothetical protein